jgi:hypothetical protein
MSGGERRRKKPDDGCANVLTRSRIAAAALHSLGGRSLSLSLSLSLYLSATTRQRGWKSEPPRERHCGARTHAQAPGQRQEGGGDDVLTPPIGGAPTKETQGFPARNGTSTPALGATANPSTSSLTLRYLYLTSCDSLPRSRPH